MKWKKLFIRKNYVLCLKNKYALKKSFLYLKPFLNGIVL